MQIKDLGIFEVFDSRGCSTIGIAIKDKKGNKFNATIPSGKSVGSKEAKSFSYQKAKKTLEIIKVKIKNKNFNSIKELDSFLLKLDKTPDKKILGGNVILGISIAFARMLANEKNIELWELLKNEYFSNDSKNNPPLIFSNFINGGAHAKNNLNIQEFMVVMRPKKPLNLSVKNLIRLYNETGKCLRKEKSIKQIPLGDEDGYSLNFKNNFEPIEILKKIIEKSKSKNTFFIGIDAAASSFFKNKAYVFENKKISRDKLLAIYKNYLLKIKSLISIEDPFAESDYPGFKKISKFNKKTLIIGDDLTVTNPKFIGKFSKGKMINAVIIKPNQIGSISETAQAIKTAEKNVIKFIISHRSGETDDNFIIHLAKASNAYGVKIGAPANERISKFDELIRLYS